MVTTTDAAMAQVDDVRDIVTVGVLLANVRLACLRFADRSES